VCVQTPRLNIPHSSPVITPTRWRVSALKLDPIWTLSARGHRIIHDNQVPHLYPWSPSLLPKPHDWGEHLNITGYWFLNEEQTRNKRPNIRKKTNSRSSNLTNTTSSIQQTQARRRQGLQTGQQQSKSSAAYKPPPALASFLSRASHRRERMPVFIGFGSIVVKDPQRLSAILTRTIAQLLVHR
jgi:hypothetical protein